MKRFASRIVDYIDARSHQIIIGWVIILSLLYSTLSIVRHNHFQSGAFDLGLYDQEIWRYSQFLPPYNTVKERFILGDHLNLTTPLLAPVFWVANDVRAILVAQAVWISISAWAIYLLARRRHFSGYVSLAIAFVYSLFYGIQSAVFFDFHAIVLGVGFLAWLIYFLESGNKKLFWVTLVLALLTQENMGLALASVGFIYLFQKKYRLTAVWFIIGGLVTSIVASKIIASLSPVGFQYAPRITLNPITNIIELFNAPEKRAVWLYSWTWFSFLPLFSPGAILAFTFDVAQYFVTGPNFARMWSPLMHHRVTLGIFLTLGTLDALVWFKSKKISPTLLATVLVFVALVCQYVFHFPLNKLTKKDFWKEESWMQDNNKLLSTIPPSFSIVTQQSLVPHLSHREHIYLFWPREHDFDTRPCGRVSCWWLDFGGKPEYLIVDTHPNQWITQLLETNDHVQAALSAMQNAGVLHKIKAIGNAQLFKITYPARPR